MNDEWAAPEPSKTALVDQRVFLLVAASILVDVLVVAAVYSWREAAGPLAYLAMALASSQLGLLGVWLGLGKPLWSLRRVLASAAGVTAWYLVFSEFRADRGSLFGLMLLASLLVTVAVGLLVARTFGLRLIKLRDQVRIADAPLEPYQFSLRQLFIWTTIAAAAATLLSVLGQSLELIYLGFIVLMMATLTWTCIWATLGRRVGWRPLMLAVLPILFAFTFILMFGPPLTVAWTLALMPLLHCLLTAGSLAIFRACGYRVTRQTMNSDER